MELEQTPGERLREFRKVNRLSQKHLSDLIGYDQRKVSRLEKGESKLDTTILKTLKESYAVNAEWLLYGEGPMFDTDEPLPLGAKDAEIERLKAEINSLTKENARMDDQIGTLKQALNIATVALDALKT